MTDSIGTRRPRVLAERVPKIVGAKMGHPGRAEDRLKHLPPAFAADVGRLSRRPQTILDIEAEGLDPSLQPLDQPVLNRLGLPAAGCRVAQPDAMVLGFHVVDAHFTPLMAPAPRGVHEHEHRAVPEPPR